MRGTHTIDNIQFLCRRCNSSKHFNATPAIPRVTYPDWDDWYEETYPYTGPW